MTRANAALTGAEGVRVEGTVGRRRNGGCMKAKPVRIEKGLGYVQCAIEDATHVSLRLPGPTGLLTLPVIRSGTRDGTGCWTWNGSTEAPTLRPSVLTQYDGADRSWRCHSWINDGAAQFLSDCSHDMANTRVALLDVDEIEPSNAK